MQIYSEKLAVVSAWKPVGDLPYFCRIMSSCCKYGAANNHGDMTRSYFSSNLFYLFLSFILQTMKLGETPHSNFTHINNFFSEVGYSRRLSISVESNIMRFSFYLLLAILVVVCIFFQWQNAESILHSQCQLIEDNFSPTDPLLQIYKQQIVESLSSAVIVSDPILLNFVHCLWKRTVKLLHRTGLTLRSQEHRSIHLTMLGQKKIYLPNYGERNHNITCLRKLLI